MFRCLALRARVQAAQYDLAAECVLAQASVESFAAAFRASEVRDVAEHPDLVELNVQMDGYYDGPGGGT
jgi:hypothetical protein